MTSRRELATSRRLVLLAAPVILGLLIAAGLAWQAERTAREHRAAMQRVVRDHADFAAFLLSRVALQEVNRRALYGFNTLYRHRPGQPLPDPAVMGTDRVEAERCPLPDGGRMHARWSAADGALALAGSSVDESTRAWLADTLPALARGAGSERILYAFRERPGEPHVLTYTVLRDSTDATLAVYATNGCFSVGDETAFDIALRATDALPPSLTGGLPNHELLTIRVLEPSGRLVHATPAAWLSESGSEGHATGTAGPDTLLGGASLQVILRPAAVERLTLGGMPRSRLPQATLLLAFAAALAVFAILQARRYLELVRMRERFMRDVSHELRTPLQQILLYADLLRLDRIDDSKGRRDALDTIDAETRRLIHMVNGVLRFARPNHAGADVPAIPLAPVVRDAAGTYLPLAKGRDVRIVVDADDEVRVRLAADALRQILMNLLDNAVKFGPAGQVLHVRLAQDAKTAVLEVDDQGPGIPASERAAVLEPYYRLERDARDVPGSGIGLTIVKDLVESSRGTVDVLDAPGGGTRIRIAWPRAEVSPVRSPAQMTEALS